MTDHLVSADIELGLNNAPSSAPIQIDVSRTSYLQGLFAKLHGWSNSLPRNRIFPGSSSDASSGEDDIRDGFEGFQIEDYPQGYPRFAALMGAHESFQVIRRFSSVRTRLLLLSQDRVAQLETRLDTIDREETSPLFLGCSRRDRNQERRAVLSELQEALAVYDDLVERSSRNLALGPAHPRDVISLKNWHMANACISREETDFLDRREDLLCLSAPEDGLVRWLERYVSERLLSMSKRTRSHISRDQYVHIYSRDSTNLLARAIVTPLIISVVLVPAIICNGVGSLTARLGIIIVSTSLFLTVLSLLTRGRMIELVVAGATYTTVLVVFITGPSLPAN